MDVALSKLYRPGERVAFITGAASRIGFACGRLFAWEGTRLVSPGATAQLRREPVGTVADKAIGYAPLSASLTEQKGRRFLAGPGIRCTFRWPAGPFCASCQSQSVEWVDPGQARIYSFTVLPVPMGDAADPGRRVPALIAFDDAPGMRLVSALIDAPLDAVAIDAPVEVHWLAAANASVPVFKLSPAT